MIHHATLFIGGRDEGLVAAYEAVGIERSESLDHPDISVFIYERFGIDEARSVKQAAYNLPVRADVRSFIIATDGITGEAQNALLKLLEEPPATARFFLVTERADMLLPTLRSRMQIVPVGNQKTGAQEIARVFLKETPGGRLAEIAIRTKNKDDAWAKDLVRGLEEILYNGTAPRRSLMLQEIMRIRRYLDQRGASGKMLLEHLALSVSA